MSLLQRLKDRLPKDKTPEELEEHYKVMDDLEKGDIPAMIIAALITFVPVALIIMAVFYGLMYLLIL